MLYSDLDLEIVVKLSFDGRHTSKIKYIRYSNYDEQTSIAEFAKGIVSYSGDRTKITYHLVDIKTGFIVHDIEKISPEEIN